MDYFSGPQKTNRLRAHSTELRSAHDRSPAESGAANSDARVTAVDARRASRHHLQRLKRGGVIRKRDGSISAKDFERLKLLKEANENGLEIAFDEDWQDLLEKLIVLEYNDGAYKRVNPVVEASSLYKQYVG